MNKRQVLDLFQAKIEEELNALIQAAKASHEAATHEESRAEDHHDTRGLEASYLAGAQAQRAGELQLTLQSFRQLPGVEFPSGEPIRVGSLVQLVCGKAQVCCLIATHGGGLSITVDHRSVQVVTPISPLGEAILGRKAGETVEVEMRDTTREYRILTVS